MPLSLAMRFAMGSRFVRTVSANSTARPSNGASSFGSISHNQARASAQLLSHSYTSAGNPWVTQGGTLAIVIGQRPVLRRQRAYLDLRTGYLPGLTGAPKASRQGRRCPVARQSTRLRYPGCKHIPIRLAFVGVQVVTVPHHNQRLCA